MSVSSVSFITMPELFWEDDASCPWAFPSSNPPHPQTHQDHADINSGGAAGHDQLGMNNPVENVKSPTLQMDDDNVPASPSTVSVSLAAGVGDTTGTSGRKKRGKKNGGGGEEKQKGKKKADDQSGAAGDGAGGAEAAGGGDDHDLHIWTERERRKKMRSMFANLHALLPHIPPKADKSTIVDEAISFIRQSEELLAKLQRQKEERRLVMQGTALINSGAYGGLPNMNSTQRSRLMLPPMSATMNYNISREAFLANQTSTHSPIMSNFPRINNYPHPASVSAPAPIPALATMTTWTSSNVVLSISGDNAHINISCVKQIGLLSTILFLLESNNLDVITIQVSSDQYRCMYMIHARPNGALQQLIAHEVHTVEDKFQKAASQIMNYITTLMG